MNKISNYRYAHAEGHTDVCYTQNSKYIITCGCEGDVRIWEGVNDADQKDTCIGERAWSLAQKGSNLYVGTDMNIVQAYTFPGMELDGIITRFTAPVTQIDVSPDGNTLLAGSCDMDLRLVDLSSMECEKFSGHKGPVLSVSLDPKLEYVVSSSCDGTVKVWCIQTKKVLKEFSTGLAKCNSFESSKALCRMHFEPRNGQMLAIPEGESIKIYERSTWNEIKSLSTSAQITIVKFSPNSRLLAAGTTNGDILVWELSSYRPLSPYDKTSDTKRDNQSITGLAWKKDCTSLVFCNMAGQLAELDIPSLDDIDKSPEQMDNENEEDIPLGVPEFEDDDDEDNENVISLGKIKSQAGFGEDGEFIGVKQETVTNNLGADEDSQSSVRSYPSSRVPEVKLQPPFQPSSTPLHLQQRFMVWNTVGIVRQFDGEGMNDIDVEFHDTSVHHNFRMSNIAGHTMAALTSQALILACPSSDGSPGKITCVLLGGRDGQREWDMSLTDGEEPLGVAGGDGWVSVITSLSLIRIMTTDGTQTDVISAPGVFVSMVGFGSMIAIVFHTPSGGLWYTVYTCQGMLLNVQVPTLPLPLSPGEHSLRWIGFTDEGQFSIFDSAGALRIQYVDVWRTISHLDDECKNKFDHYFVVGISELYQTIRCILCKGTYYPQVIPKPLISEVKWKIPLCEMDADKSKLEEEYLRSRITVPNLSSEPCEEGRRALEKVISVTAMKLFALACRSNLDRRAISLCEIMPSLEVINLASKYAVKIGRQHLASKVTEVAHKFVQNIGRSSKEEEPIITREAEVSYNSSSAAKENYSQDMFEESQSETSEVKENLILKMQERKKKEKELSPKPLRIIRGGNPFKKANESISTQNGGTFSNDESQQGKVNFVTWFGENKLRLQEEFPLLKESELIISAMKKYKQTINQSTNNSQEMDSSFSEEIIETKKRKVSSNDEDSGSAKKKPNSLSKLKTFSFKPRS